MNFGRYSDAELRIFADRCFEGMASSDFLQRQNYIAMMHLLQAELRTRKEANDWTGGRLRDQGGIADSK